MRFDAMGSWAEVIVNGGPPGLASRARARIADLEGRWSRFRPDSEVSRLNRSAGGRRCAVSRETALLVARAADARRLTGGRFDAGVLADVVAAGYDRAAGVATVAPTTGFDPGGIGKGLAADLVVEELMAAGAAGACVNLGGDLRMEGVPPGGGPWVIAVEDSFAADLCRNGAVPQHFSASERPGPGGAAADLCRATASETTIPASERPGAGGAAVRVGLERGAVATSSVLKRAWAGGHHLIDPRTGRPAQTDAVAATVIAGEAWRAEAVATAAVVAGVADGLALIAACGLTGLIVDATGVTHPAPGLGRFLG